MLKALRRAALVLALSVALASPAHAAKYIFLFIGDGMGPTQVNVTEAFLAGERARRKDTTPRESQLNMTSMRHIGTVATSSLSGVTDSAAAATALATGHKTANGAICVEPKSGARWESILSQAARAGMKTGVVSNAFLQDATPAAFIGAHTDSRSKRYEIGLEICGSSVDFIGGAGFIAPKGKDKKQRDLYDVARSKGFTVTNTTDALAALSPGTRAIASHPKLSSGSMPFAIDDLNDADRLRLADFTRKAIEMLDGDGGFFLVVEGGRIDIACHANDAAAAVREVIDLDEAIAEAMKFARAHRDETLIVVTADHETGGMKYAGGYEAGDNAKISTVIGAQRASYIKFEGKVTPSANTNIDSLISRAEEHFGVARGTLVKDADMLSAFKMSMTRKDARPTKDKAYKKKYSTYDPFTTAVIHQANASIGITWTTYYHTGRDVPIFAYGAGAEAFAGHHDNTEINALLRRAIDAR